RLSRQPARKPSTLRGVPRNHPAGVDSRLLLLRREILAGPFSVSFPQTATETSPADLPRHSEFGVVRGRCGRWRQRFRRALADRSVSRSQSSGGTLSHIGQGTWTSPDPHDVHLLSLYRPRPSGRPA